MVAWRNKFIAVLAIVSFVLSFTACQVACASGDDDSCDSKTVQHHCIGQCGCHGVTVVSAVAMKSPSLVDCREFVIATMTDNSRLVPASIFNPPRA
jgi:hypothetical protein